SIRSKRFNRIAFTEVPLNLASKGFNVGYGAFINSGASGLIITTLVMYVGRILLFLKYVVKNPWDQLFGAVGRSQVESVQKKYRAYPRSILLSQVIQNVSNYVPIFIIPIYLGTKADVGLLSNAFLVLDMPVRLLGSGISNVYFQKSASLWPEMKSEVQTKTIKLFYGLLLLAIAIALPLRLFGEEIYAFVFGEEWATAGLLAGIISLFYFLRYIGMPLSNLYLVTRNERLGLGYHIFILAARCAGLFLAIYWDMDFINAMILFTYFNLGAYFFYTFHALKLVGIRLVLPVILTLGSLGLLWWLGTL
ncbi:MAG: hypothetical protein HRT74_12095, partial [Flavobacteriales bacterium]|nr:hypothetical protein [Flavobacteriales bacterium]